jgi:hypothetical protein
VPQVLENALNGTLADPKSLANIPAGKPFGLQFKKLVSLKWQEVSKPPEDLVSLSNLARRITRSSELARSIPVGPKWFLAMHVGLSAAGAAIFVDYFILRGSGQKGDKVPRVFKLGSASFDAPEETSPNALEEIERIKSRPQETRQLPPNYQPNLTLVTSKQFASSILVARRDPRQEARNVAIVFAPGILGRIDLRHGLFSSVDLLLTQINVTEGFLTIQHGLSGRSV